MTANKYTILVIEDESNINNIVSALLQANGYKTISARSCGSGKMLFASHHPDLVILDLGLPDADGTEFLREIRRDSFTPVIVLSARTEESEKVDALDLGANDYVTKPFGSAELIARVRSALRSSRRSSDSEMFNGSIYESNGLKIDYDARRIFIDNAEIKLTQTEYNIIALLSEHSGKVLTYSYIIKAIWGYNDIGSVKKLQVNMANIRNKLGSTPGNNQYIFNELGVGYRMHEENE